MLIGVSLSFPCSVTRALNILLPTSLARGRGQLAGHNLQSGSPTNIDGRWNIRRQLAGHNLQSGSPTNIDGRRNIRRQLAGHNLQSGSPTNIDARWSLILAAEARGRRVTGNFLSLRSHLNLRRQRALFVAKGNHLQFQVQL